MTALHALRVARAACVNVRLYGDRLRLTAASPPPPDVLEAIVQHKPEIIALLQAEAVQGGWDRENWQAYFDERSAIGEYDGGFSRIAAENMAYEATVIEYLNRAFAPSAPGRCAACGEGGRPQAPLLPFGMESRGHCWLHAGCWADWDARLRAEAVAALAMLGIEPRPLLSDDDRDFLDHDLGR